MGITSRYKLVALACLGSLNAYSGTWAAEHTLASVAYEKGDYAAAEQHDRAALAEAGSFGENDLRLEATLNQLAAVLQARGVCCETELLMRRALIICEAHSGQDSIEAATSKANLAAVLLQNGHAEESRKLTSEALATAERVLDSNSPLLTPILAQGALSEQNAHHFDRAEELLKRARVLAEDDATEDPRRLMQIWRYLGSLYSAAGRFDDAEQAYKNLIALSTSRFGPEKQDTANALTGLGDVLSQRKYYSAARPYLQRAVDIYQGVHDTGVSSYVTALQDLSMAELYLGQAQPAEQHALLVINTLKNQSTAGSEALAVANNNLGQVYATQGRYKEAEQATTRAKELLVAALGDQNAKVAAVTSNLGALYVQEKKYSKAEALYDESAAIDAKVSGPGSVAYARDLNRLGVLYNYQRRYAQSEQTVRKALEIDSKVLGANSPVLAEPYVNLANSLHGQHRLDEAAECFHRAIDIMTNAGQKDARNMAVILEQYALLLKDMQRWADAEKASVAALGIRVKETVNGETFH